MKTVFAIALIAALSQADIDVGELKFIQWMSKFGKHYETMEEFIERREIWLAKELVILGHNSMPSNFILGHNKFSDWKKEEMSVMYGEKESPESNAECLAPPSGVAAPNGDLPDYVNWAEAGMTTPIKDQGSCGSCWTFATTGTVESANAIFGSGLVSLSE